MSAFSRSESVPQRLMYHEGQLKRRLQSDILPIRQLHFLLKNETVWYFGFSEIIGVEANENVLAWADIS